MRYIVPVNHSTSQAQISQWASVGVEEFYFGYMPEAWVKEYGWEVCTNRRPYPTLPHLTTLEGLRTMIRWIHETKAKAIFAVNEHVYPLELAKNVVQMIIQMQQEGADAVLIADPAILTMLRTAKLRLPVHASIGMGVQNVQSVGFFRDLGINRFVLPRKLRPDEIVSLLRETPKEVEFEVFLMGEWCFYNDQTCFCTHGHGRNPFCYKQKGLAEPQPHSLLNEHYEYSWCGLCLVEVLSAYHDRILYKIPVRSDVFKTLKVIKQLSNLSGPSTRSRVELIKMMQCQQRYCAYEFEKLPEELFISPVTQENQ